MSVLLEKMVELGAESFDRFGALAFLYVTAVAFWILKTKKPLPKTFAVLLILVGLGGLIVDLLFVYATYLRN
jgi:hypothetical protein